MALATSKSENYFPPTTSQLQRQEAFDWAPVRIVTILQEGEGALPARAFLSCCTY